MKWKQLGILLVIVITAVKAAPTPKWVDVFKLPRTSIPLRYDLALTTTVLSRREFTGIVIISIEMTEDSDTITLHSKGLTVQSVNLTDSKSDEIIQTHSMDEEKDFIHIQSKSRQLLKGEKLSLEIAFSGLIQLNMLGFYRSSYKVNTSIRYLAATQFEGTYARTAFICYDEPEYKATFRLTLKTGATLTAISNTDSSRILDGRGGATTIFKTTPRMSAYLLAFVIFDSEYSSIEAKREPGETINRVYARQAAIDDTEYALTNSVLLLKELERYAMYKYELPKMYHAAVPDFAFGAMENWGLIIYKETNIIGNENSHHYDALRILQVVAHELGHQFFGNLVTCKSWDYTWLNEGFATLFEFLLVENLNPDLRIRDFFNVNKVQTALTIDSVESTHAMTYGGETITEIIYDKAGSVIRMFQNSVGEDIFREALKTYLTDNNHSAVVSADLYEAFEAIITRESFNDFAFTAAFKSWEEQKGYPLVHVSINNDTRHFEISQERYYAASEARVENDDRSWYIPLNLASASSPDFDDTKFTHYFENNQGATKMFDFPDQFDSSKWFVFNKQQMGYYRVNYDFANWHELIKILNSENFEQIHVLNRAQLIDDSLNLAADGYLGYQVAFGILSYLSRETDYIPWRAAVRNLDKLDILFKEQPQQSNFSRFIKYLNGRMFAFYGVDDQIGDLLPEKFARELAFDWACRMGDAKCLKKSLNEVQLMVMENKTVPASLEISYICNGLKSAEKSIEFENLFKRMQSSTDQAERQRIIDGLICSSDSKMLYTMLEGVLIDAPDTDYRMHERQRILNNIFIKSSVGTSALLDFIANYFDEAVKTFSMSSVESVIIAMSKRMSTDEDEVKLTNLLDKLNGNLTQSFREKALKNIIFNKSFIKSEKFAEITEYLESFLKTLDEVENQLRLPKTSAPQRYRIHIDASNVHKGDKVFKGKVEIDVRIKELTSHIILHSKNQQIVDLKVFNLDGSGEVPIVRYHLYPEADTLTIYFMRSLEENSQITVHIEYIANMLTYEAGFYQSFYVVDKETRYLGATQFQATDARFAFPCYDEPAYKATFELKITHIGSYNALSNTFGARQMNQDGNAITTFEPSLLMSTYLLAFVVSDLESISNNATKQLDDTLHRIWVRPDSLKKAQFALENSEAVLKALEQYVDFDFKLPKVDSVGVPRKSGAMENWGMVTYRESAMIYEENYDDIPHSAKLSGVNVISHELAHQFFGDSVTCEWWNYIWLNEGFATLFEYHLMGVLYPKWRTRDFFNLRRVQNAMRRDSDASTRAMTSTLLTTSEILSAFDYVVYDKAGSVLRMFQHAVGEETFKASLKLYLQTNDYSPVNSQHLVDAFTAIMSDNNVSDFDFDKAFRSWELQKGYPVIHVSFTESRQFHITQERYFTQKRSTSNDTSSWYIPLNFATASNPDFDDTKITDFFVNDQPMSMIDAPEQFNASQWYVFNKQQLGYYRVNYDFANWHALIVALNSDEHDKIHVLNRVQLIDDALNFAAGGYLDYDVAFGILSSLERETEYSAWYAAERFISQLYTTFGSLNTDLNEFVRGLSDKFYEAFKVPMNYVIPPEGVYERYSRELAFKLGCNSGNTQCLFDTYIQNRLFLNFDGKIPKGLEDVIFCSGLRGTGKQGDWTSMFMKLQSSSDSVRLQIINALGCSDETSDLNDYLEATLITVLFKPDEKREVLKAVLNSHSGFDVVVNFIKNNVLDILGNFGYENLEALLMIPAQTIKTEQQQTSYLSFLKTQRNLDPSSLTKIISIIDSNLSLQKTPENIEIMRIIRKLLGRPEEVTTTIATQTEASTTTFTTTAQTTLSSTVSTTQSSTTSSTSSISSTTTTSPITSAITSQTEIPTTPIPTTSSTTPDPSNVTTLGASTIGISILTLVINLLIAISLKH